MTLFENGQLLVSDCLSNRALLSHWLRFEVGVKDLLRMLDAVSQVWSLHSRSEEDWEARIQLSEIRDIVKGLIFRLLFRPV